MQRVVLALALLAPALVWADDWKPLVGYTAVSYLIDPSSVQRGERTDSHAAVIAIWVKEPEHASFQVWIDCGFRQSQTFNSPYAGIWTAWTPIPPESMEWAIWEYLCHKNVKKK